MACLLWLDILMLRQSDIEVSGILYRYHQFIISHCSVSVYALSLSLSVPNIQVFTYQKIYHIQKNSLVYKMGIVNLSIASITLMSGLKNLTDLLYILIVHILGYSYNYFIKGLSSYQVPTA